MFRTRVIPCLLLQDRGLVKTIKFRASRYLGDPINAVRIFNEKEVDELIFLDITATAEKRKPHFDLIADIASECFMPFSYGGGIADIEDARHLFKLGVEKIIITTQAINNPDFIRETANLFGNQSIVVGIDVKKNILGRYEVFINAGRKNTKIKPEDLAIRAEKMGAGEIFLNSIDRDGTMQGYDIDLIRMVSGNITIPLIASGGAGSTEDFKKAIKVGGASAVSAGSLFIYQGKKRGFLINTPGREILEKILG